MSRILFSLLWLVSCLHFSAIQAATTVVPPGVGTLKTAVDNALDGDTLLLQTGDYNLSAAIDVALGIAIRPEDSSKVPRVVLNSNTMTLTGNVTPITLQALTFVGPGTISTSGAGQLNLLENDFTDTTLSWASTTGPCYVVGNAAQRSGSATAGYLVNIDADCYVAGNSFEGTASFTARSGYFIGNKVSTSHTPRDGITLYAAYAIGNEIIRDLDSNSPTALTTNYTAVHARTPLQTGLTSNWPLYANNIIKVIGAVGSAPPGNILSMSAMNVAANSVLHNNVMDFTQFEWVTQGEQGIINVNENSTIQGNIILNGLVSGMGAVAFIDAGEQSQSDVSYNNCYNNALDCGAVDGNLNLDSLFVDTVDYVLGPGSPAIDAGPVNQHQADLDGSRNDMGIHGGPHPFSQYKAQLDPLVFAPFVYPVFDEIQILSGAQISVSAIGVARFK